jgi:hypothetical protein
VNETTEVKTGRLHEELRANINSFSERIRESKKIRQEVSEVDTTEALLTHAIGRGIADT